MLRPGTLTRLALRALDSAARILPRSRQGPEHLRTGRRGEEAAYFYLRKIGYVMIARNYRGIRSRSELDLVGWDGGTLCFIEVKTRTSRDLLPAEAAVDPEKQRDLSRVAREFLRKVPGDSRFQFDIVSVYLGEGADPEIELFRNAFPLAWVPPASEPMANSQWPIANSVLLSACAADARSCKIVRCLS